MFRSRWYPLIGLALVVAGVTGLVLVGRLAPTGTFRGDLEVYSSSGQRVFLTGAGGDGPAIAFQEGPFWLSMHGGGCATCHGADGRGGRPMMLNIIAPDIRYSALVQRGYSDGLIARAMTAGLNAQGQPLDPAMPRWQMSADDLADVIAHLKTLW